jgi:hypothetical protein
MPRSTEIQNIIEEAVAEVLDAALPHLRSEIVRRAVEVVESLTPAPGSSPSDLLNAASASIHDSGSQAEILRHLLEGEARFAGRVALFVVKGSAINGWQGIGFDDNEAIKSLNITTGSGLVGKAIQARSAAAGPPQEFDAGFISAMRSPADDHCLVLPLVVRKAGGSVVEDTPHAQPSVSLAASAAASVPLASGPEEDELHKKARRFAKLLVEEIKLYNQTRVEEGRQHKDLYSRLKVDIEKSRSTYDKRYAESAVASADYFTQELIRILAENDASLMGAGFQRS